jgi:methylated-DNA-[protein]-cysteine S-methyltransferase
MLLRYCGGRRRASHFRTSKRRLPFMSENGQRHGRPPRYFHPIMTTTYYTLMDSPVGTLRLEASDKGVAGIKFDRPGRQRPSDGVENPRHPVLVQTARQLREYFAGRRQSFELTLDVSGTPFQRAVWNALLTIPFGETRTYGELARQVGRPSAARAVGAANGQNPVAIVAPCHRVIGASGGLTGFAGGLDAKAHLLRLEGGRF